MRKIIVAVLIMVFLASWSYGDSSRNQGVTSTAEQSYGQSGSLGTSKEYARRDHTHGTPINPIPAHLATSDPHGQYTPRAMITESIGSPGSAVKIPTEKAVRTEFDLRAPSVVTVKNVSGGAINKGEVVYYSGVSGAYPSIVKAKADASATMPAAGIVLVTVANGATTTIQLSGEVIGLNTSAFTAGDLVYVSSSTAGGLTKIEPQHPFLSQLIGIVTVSDATVGKIQLFISTAHEGDDYGSNRDTFKIGTGAGAGAVNLDFVNANTGVLAWTPTGTRTITIPDETGTLATQAYAVPYTGATGDVNVGVHGIVATTVSTGAITVYRCATAGALRAGVLTVTAADCGSTTDTGLRVN